MIGEVSIKTVDSSDFDEGAIRNKADVEQQGYMGGKVCVTHERLVLERTANINRGCCLRPPTCFDVIASSSATTFCQ